MVGPLQRGADRGIAGLHAHGQQQLIRGAGHGAGAGDGDLGSRGAVGTGGGAGLDGQGTAGSCGRGGGVATLGGPGGEGADQHAGGRDAREQRPLSGGEPDRHGGPPESVG